LQHALYRAAKADPGRRFHALMDKVIRSDVLWRAWVMVRGNNGAPGIDKVTLAAVEEYGDCPHGTPPDPAHPFIKHSLSTDGIVVELGTR
jgi:hypothetical protein